MRIHEECSEILRSRCSWRLTPGFYHGLVHVLHICWDASRFTLWIQLPDCSRWSFTQILFGVISKVKLNDSINQEGGGSKMTGVQDHALIALVCSGTWLRFVPLVPQFLRTLVLSSCSQTYRLSVKSNCSLFHIPGCVDQNNPNEMVWMRAENNRTWTTPVLYSYIEAGTFRLRLLFGEWTLLTNKWRACYITNWHELWQCCTFIKWSRSEQTI